MEVTRETALRAIGMPVAPRKGQEGSPIGNWALAEVTVAGVIAAAIFVATLALFMHGFGLAVAPLRLSGLQTWSAEAVILMGALYLWGSSRFASRVQVVCRLAFVALVLVGLASLGAAT
jgi:hypothetical protein